MVFWKFIGQPRLKARTAKTYKHNSTYIEHADAVQKSTRVSRRLRSKVRSQYRREAVIRVRFAAQIRSSQRGSRQSQPHHEAGVQEYFAALPERA